MKFTSLFTFLLGCSAIANAADSTRVLFIGNSFTGNNDMPGIFQKICKAKKIRWFTLRKVGKVGLR